MCTLHIHTGELKRPAGPEYFWRAQVYKYKIILQNIKRLNIKVLPALFDMTQFSKELLRRTNPPHAIVTVHPQRKYIFSSQWREDDTVKVHGGPGRHDVRDSQFLPPGKQFLLILLHFMFIPQCKWVWKSKKNLKSRKNQRACYEWSIVAKIDIPYFNGTFDKLKNQISAEINGPKDSQIEKKYNSFFLTPETWCVESHIKWHFRDNMWIRKDSAKFSNWKSSEAYDLFKPCWWLCEDHREPELRPCRSSSSEPRRSSPTETSPSSDTPARQSYSPGGPGLFLIGCNDDILNLRVLCMSSS
jgi:hypothetical protein